MESQFSIKDVVWARARKPKSEIFWPAQVIETTPKKSTKKIIASVRFLGDNTEEDVRNPKDIKKWNCKEQDSYIQKGRSSLNDSNSRIAFNKGIKEGRKLFKQNLTGTTGVICSNSNKTTEEKESSTSTGVVCSNSNESTEGKKSSATKSTTFVNEQKVIHLHTLNNNSDKNYANSQLPDPYSKQNSSKAQKKETTPRKRAIKGKASEEELNQGAKSSQKNTEKQQKESQEKSESHTSECWSTRSSEQTGKRKKSYDELQVHADCVNNDNYSEKLYTSITRKSPRKHLQLSSNSSTNVCNDNSSSNVSLGQTSQEKTCLRRSPRKTAERTHELLNAEENKKSNKTKKESSQAIENVNETEDSKKTKTDSNSTKCGVVRKRKQEAFQSNKKKNKSSNQCDDLQNRTLNKQESESLNDTIISNHQTCYWTQPKRRKISFEEDGNMPPSEATCIDNKEDESCSTSKQVCGMNNQHNFLASTFNNNNYDYDSEESSDQELMETALSPNSKNLKFQIHDIVWAKFHRGAYWPAQVKRIQKKPKKIYVKFLGYAEKRCFPCTRLISFTCDFQQREEFINEAEKEDASNFKKAFTEAEDLVRKKALGINIEPDYDDDDYEDFELGDNEEPKHPVDLVDVQDENPEEKANVRRSKRPKKQVSKYNQGMLSCIRESKPMLKDILEGKITCERHSMFINGRTKEKSNLKHQSGFGPITDHDLENDIIELLMEYHSECLPKKSNISGLPYVLDVWLPEAIIYAIQKIDGVERKTAETTFSQGANSNFDHVELMQQLKSKELTDEDRQASLERADRLMQKLIQTEQND